jgi:squalene synthase HpnC
MAPGRELPAAEYRAERVRPHQSLSAVPPAHDVMTRASTENFPVASRFLPRATRSHTLAIYGFARLVDDLGDEAAGDRMALLHWLEGEVDMLFRGEPTHPLMRRLVPTVREFDIPPEPFRRLIAANRQDQTISRYETFDDLRGYCRLSADPVGHLVLYVLRAASPDHVLLSDDVCTGLQLTEHWQDVREDALRGRVYLPQEDLRRFGCSEQELSSGPARPTFRRLMAFQVNRARGLLDRGAPLARRLGGRAGLAVAAFVAGGRAALDAIERAGHDVLETTPRPSRPHRAWVLARTLAGGR